VRGRARASATEDARVLLEDESTADLAVVAICERGEGSFACLAVHGFAAIVVVDGAGVALENGVVMRCAPARSGIKKLRNQAQVVKTFTQRNNSRQTS
jgi:hypothetical protein